MLGDLLIVFILIAINALFAGAEIAVLTTRKTRVAELVEAGSGGARAVAKLRDRPERFLATVQVGITVVSATSAAYGGEYIAARLSTELSGLGRWAEEISLALVVALVSYLSLVIGELVPKSLALRHAERYAVFIGRPLLWLSQLMRPLIWLLTASSNAVLRVFRDRTSFTESRLSREELRELVEEAGKTGEVDRPSSEIAARALEFGQVTVAELMVPRTAIAALPRQAPAPEIKRLLLEEGHSRMPVYEGSVDKIIGYVIAKDVLSLLWNQPLVILDDILRPPRFVPKGARAGDVLRELQRSRAQLAIVLDEHGTVAGLITIEDLVEDLVGEILSEDEPEHVRVEADGTIVAEGDVSIRELDRRFDLHLPEGPWTTIAGLVIGQAGWMPQAGARFTLPDGTILTVTRVTEQRIEQVKIKRPV
jgi:putative hemolysin